MNEPDNIFPVTEQEILEHYSYLFKNPFQTRTISVGNVWNVHCPITFHHNWSWYCESYTKGNSTSAILVNSKGEKDLVEFWKYYRDGRVQYGYSFKKRELYPTILN